MNTDREQRIQEFFEAAKALKADRRVDFLDGACLEDPSFAKKRHGQGV